MTGFFFRYENHISTLREQFPSDRLSYLVLQGQWCDLIVLKCACPN
jgi:hypothetical protein